MQINSQNQNISFQGLYLTPEIQHQKGFRDVIDYLFENSTKNDLFIKTIEEAYETTQTPIKKFEVNAQTLSGDMRFTAKSESLSMEHLKESIQNAVKGLTDKLLDHHSVNNPPPTEKSGLEVRIAPITPSEIMQEMSKQRQN